MLTFIETFDSFRPWDAVKKTDGIWATDYGYGGVWSYTLNDEKQLYSPYFGNFDHDNHVIHSDGTLSLVAHATENAAVKALGYNYTSGVITTKPSFSQTYGYFEMRADVPVEPGTWPAFWLMPTDGSWPPEIDIMEMVGSKPGEVVTTIHDKVAGDVGHGVMAGVENGYHTFAVDWQADRITWYVDQKAVFQVDTPAAMHKPFYILANLAVGGSWAGPIDLGSDGVADLRIDHIKVWDKNPYAGDPAPSTTLQSPAAGSAGASTGASQGGAGSDTLFGTPGNDVLRGGDGDDVLYGAEGFDDMHGNQGNDTLHGGGATDWVVGGRGDDMLHGDDGNDIVLGNLGRDTLDGNAGDDVVRGGQGDDQLVGGSGNDWLSGDRGDDTLTGGAGADIFHTFADAGVDLVADFNGAEGDRIMLERPTAFTLTQSGGDTVLEMVSGRVILKGVGASAFDTGWVLVA